MSHYVHKNACRKECILVSDFQLKLPVNSNLNFKKLLFSEKTFSSLNDYSTGDERVRSDFAFVQIY